MKKILIAFASAGTLALAACGTPAEEAEEQRLESQEDILEEEADMADDMGMEAESEMLDDQADAMGEAADEVDGTNLIDDSEMDADNEM